MRCSALCPVRESSLTRSRPGFGSTVADITSGSASITLLSSVPNIYGAAGLCANPVGDNLLVRALLLFAVCTRFLLTAVRLAGWLGLAGWLADLL